MRTPLFYRSKPLFGLDIGHATAKVVQLKKGSQPAVGGYGFVEFEEKFIHDGEIMEPAKVAEILKPLLERLVIGRLFSNRVATSIPIANTFTRTLSLPAMAEHDLAEAVRLEAEQYIPLPIKELYLEYQVLPKHSQANTEEPASKEVADGAAEEAEDTSAQEENLDILMVAVPKRIVDSYEQLFDLLNLENFIIEPSLFAIVRAVEFADPSQLTKIIVDFGATSSDLAIYKGTVRFTSTVATGGDHLTEKIAGALNLSHQQAQSLKAHHGLEASRWQKEIVAAVESPLADLATEIKKLSRYWKDKTSNAQPINDLVVVGGGANLPGLSDHLAKITGMQVSASNPWEKLKIAPLQPPHPLETALYTTAIGLAMTELGND